jgi:hydrogenase expression/formation protein HypD
VKYLDEFRDPDLARGLLAEIERITTRPWSIMEVCGGQTHAIIRNGIDQLLPDHIELIHGPGCPVCVTPLAVIDKALAIAGRPEVIFCSFGDMLRVPGSDRDLFTVRSEGGDVRVVYSPLDAVQLAEDNPDREVVFFAIGFETTAPANAMAVHLASQRGLDNFSVLVSHVLVPPAIDAVASSPNARVDGFLAAGHVCTVMGTGEYGPLVDRHQVPVVVTGFEPLDVLDGIRRVVVQLEAGRAELDNAYARVVSDDGNPAAQQMVGDVFEVCDRTWRGIGEIPASGWRLSAPYRAFDAEPRFAVSDIATRESELCRSGEVLQGLIKPTECPAFGAECTPRTPLGATMVSSEGACAAYYQYRRLDAATSTVGASQ